MAVCDMISAQSMTDMETQSVPALEVDPQTVVQEVVAERTIGIEGVMMIVAVVMTEMVEAHTDVMVVMTDVQENSQ